jgi:stage III sporulation protein SpoIIIAA
VLATAHGRTWEDLRKRPAIRMLLKEHVFDRIVLLKGIGKREAILDADGEPVEIGI